MIYHQAIIVGGGLAGLRAAIELNRRGIDTAIISKVHPLRSHTVAAQGGINVAIGNNPLSASDNPMTHAFDTIKGSDYLADQEAVLKMCRRGPGLVYEMEHGACHGLIALDLKSGRLVPFSSDAVIFATGGAGRLYGKSTNALINTGMGMAVPYRAGVPLKDMGFIQFHPTTLLGKNILITEGCRGEGGFLLNNKGERFLAKYSDSQKDMEVAPRDIIARNITREIMAGGGFDNSYVHLYLRQLGGEKNLKRVAGIRDICMEFIGID